MNPPIYTYTLSYSYKVIYTVDSDYNTLFE